MKKGIIAIFLICGSTLLFAQNNNEDDERKGFQTDRIFVGGSVGLGLGGWNGGFNIGANPEVGYSIANWLDAGISGNVNYYSFRAEVNNGIRQRSTNLGVGVFTRIYPIRSFFIQALPEYNWVSHKFKDMRFAPDGPTQTIKQEAPSLLLGVGYGSRDIGNSSFFTVLMIDVGQNINSPYVDSHGSKLPILRSGFNFYLGRKKK
jgi:hypothetical protein